MTRRDEEAVTTGGKVKQRRARRPKRVAAQPNFGSIDLVDIGQLGPGWSRNNYGYGDPMISRIVGHENGVPDVCLIKEPGKYHQFCWATPKAEMDLNRKLQQGYRWVTDKEFIKNAKIWLWRDGMIWYAGQSLMAREADLYFQDKARRDGARDKRDRNQAADANLAAAAREIAQRHGSRENVAAAFPNLDADGLTPFVRS